MEVEFMDISEGIWWLYDGVFCVVLSHKKKRWMQINGKADHIHPNDSQVH